MLYNLNMSFLAYKTKLQLNNQQKTLMRQCAGYSRWLWNWGLDLKQKAYSEGIKLNKSQLRKFYTNYVKPLFILFTSVPRYSLISYDSRYPERLSPTQGRDLSGGNGGSNKTGLTSDTNSSITL